ncbi:MAG: aldehyde dehydrogenase [Pseudomonadales bacterium]|nr:aldehyde dehydrogenase [Pseudomonadales bacterium]
MNAVIEENNITELTDWAKAAVSQQRQYFESGATRSYEFRLAQLNKLKEAIIKYADDIEKALKQDIGRPPFEAYVETSTALDEVKHTIKHLRKWMNPKRVGTNMWAQPGRSRIECTPLGVTMIMGPYNYPFLLCIQPLIGALAAGNTVVMKPSSLNPATADVIEKMMQEMYNDEYVKVFKGSTEVTNELLKQRFDHIFFTGSPRVGKIIMAAAAQHLTPVTLELGGKSPTIVHADANLTIAAKRIAAGKMLNVGQTCVAPDHIFVHASIREQFEAELCNYLKEAYGDNPQASPDLGRMINDKHFERVAGLIDTSKVIHGGQTDAKDKFIAPTIMSGVTMDDPVMQEEIFGPVLPLVEYNNLSEVYEHVKKIPDHPLALYLFTESNQVEKDVLANIQFGGGCINNTVMHVANGNLPFGGVGESGIGSYHGRKSFETFSHQRSILKATTRFDIKFRYAPYKNKVNIMKMMMR